MSPYKNTLDNPTTPFRGGKRLREPDLEEIPDSDQESSQSGTQEDRSPKKKGRGVNTISLSSPMKKLSIRASSKKGSTMAPSRVQQQRGLVSTFSTSLLRGGHVYGIAGSQTPPSQTAQDSATSSDQEIEDPLAQDDEMQDSGSKERGLDNDIVLETEEQHDYTPSPSQLQEKENEEAESDNEPYPPLQPDYSPGLDYMKEPLVMEGEAFAEDRDTPSNQSPESEDGKPVRYLTDFTIYQDDSGRIRATGTASPKIADEDLDGDEDEVFSTDIYTSPIIECYHGWDEPEGCHVWIETLKAWYILLQPTPDYLAIYQPFLLVHAFTHLLISTCLKDQKATWGEFKESFRTGPAEAEELRVVEETLHMKATWQEFWPLRHDICATFISWEGSNAISDVPLASYLTSNILPSPSKPKPIPKSTVTVKLKQKTHMHHPPQSKSRAKPTVNINNNTTPLIHHLASPYFLRPLHCLGTPLEAPLFDQQSSQQEAEQLLQNHDKTPSTIKWGQELLTDMFDDITCYEHVILNGKLYHPGDIVLVKIGDDDKKERHKVASSEPSKSQNELANSFWFVEIIYLFSKSGAKPHFHGRWLMHGSKTVLREAASTQELFLTNECDDVAVEAIVAHCDATFIPQGGEEPGDLDFRTFFYRSMWLPDQAAFIDASKLCHEEANFVNPSCLSCATEEEQERQSSPWLDDTGCLTYNNINYHKLDFVYIAPLEHVGVYQLGQILSIYDSWSDGSREHEGQRPMLKIKPLKRSEHVKHHGAPQDHDERRLFYLSDTIKCLANKLRGKFYAIPFKPTPSQELEDWLAMPDHFYITDVQGTLSKIQKCDSCFSAQQAFRKELAQVPYDKVLKAMDIFSGCGGFTVGLDQTGFISTKWSIEYDDSAAETLHANTPEDHAIFKGDVNRLLEDALLQQASPSQAGRAEKLPNRDEVDLIYCGPPCQSFSKANSQRRDDDPRHSLSMTALSFVDYYRPQYFLLENVQGMTEYSLVDANHRGVKMGIIKIILRCLLAMNYQVHFNVLQAGAYGAPQSRRRLIILASQRSFPLPDLPKPTHAYEHKLHSVDLTDGFRLPNLSSKQAAFNSVTVNAAIGDLPQFNWKDPSKPHSHGQDPKDHYGRYSPLQYHLRKPFNRYQKWIRNGSSEVHQHFTKSYAKKVVERVVNIEMTPKANWTSLPNRLKELEWQTKKRSKHMYRRLEGDKQFPTSTCTVDPASRNGNVIHPTQKRVITLREYARSQGFPDTFIFHSVNDSANDMFRQVGNAVPIPLGIAIGREIGKAVVRELHQEEA